MFSSFQLQLATAEAARRQNDRRTFSEPLHIAPSQTAAYKEFLSEFYQTIYKRRQELQVLLEQDVAGLGRFYQELVVDNDNKDKEAAASAAAVSHEDFWQRYCWRCDANRILAEWNEKEQQVAAARSRQVMQQTTSTNEDNDAESDDDESVPEQQEEDSLSFSNPPSSKDDSEHDGGKSNTHNKDVPVAVAVVLQKQQENNQEQQQTPPSTTTSKKKWSWLWWTATLVVVAVAVAVAILQVQQPDLLSPLSSFFFSSPSTTTTTTGAELQVSPPSGSINAKRAGFGRLQTPAASPVVDGHGDDDYYGYGYGSNEQQTPQVSYYYLMRRWVPALAKERVFSPIYGLFYTRTVLKWKPYYYYQEATTTTAATDGSGYDSNQNYYNHNNKNARESTRNNGQQNGPTEGSNSFYRSTARLFNYY